MKSTKKISVLLALALVASQAQAFNWTFWKDLNLKDLKQMINPVVEKTVKKGWNFDGEYFDVVVVKRRFDVLLENAKKVANTTASAVVKGYKAVNKKNAKKVFGLISKKAKLAKDSVKDAVVDYSKNNPKAKIVFPVVAVVAIISFIGYKVYKANKKPKNKKKN
ncbi:hypothetical protein KAH94_06080 [bacterium]|nr:hypothetical protein [bacterium]